MQFRISKKFINSLSNIKDRFIRRVGPVNPNESMNRYYALARDNKTWSNVPDKDDFNWSIYNLHYRGELELGEKDYTLKLKSGDYHFLDNELEKVNDAILPLHASHRLAYETILQLKPKSLFEMGVGNGMHLHNLHVLSSDIKLSGIDRSEGQLNFMKESYPNLNADVKKFDATIAFEDRFPGVDVGYSQAVIMHIKTGDSHLVALANLFNISKNQVVLMENWNNHEFMKDIQNLFNKKIISWKKLYTYYRVSKDDPNIRIMVCSQYPLNYTELRDYNEMKKGLEKQSFFRRLKRWLSVK